MVSRPATAACGAPAVSGWATCEVLIREELCHDTVLLTVSAPAVAASATPGQFVHVGVASPAADDPFLRRPISLAQIDGEKGTIGLIIRAVGRGTRALVRAVPGDRLDLLGPVGRGFPVEYGDRPVLLVGGGVGAAPLLPLAHRLAAGGNMRFLLGSRTEGELWGAGLAQRFGVNCAISTDDGSAGHTGLVTDLLERELSGGGDVAAICACGPTPMMRAVAAIAARHEIACYVSLEQRMGCGVGACLGCAWPRAGGGYVRVCVDGPVFDATEVIL